jgi:hypothetical protein
MMLVIGALVLMSIFILGVNSSESGQIKNTLTNQAVITATGIAQTLMDQIQTESFDQQTVNKSVSVPDSLTAPGSLGKDAGETTITTFNDVDDYNNYTETDTVGILGTFNVKAKVSYCTTGTGNMDPDTYSSVRTFSKRVDISVYNKYLFFIDTLKISKVISYY